MNESYGAILDTVMERSKKFHKEYQFPFASQLQNTILSCLENSATDSSFHRQDMVHQVEIFCSETRPIFKSTLADFLNKFIALKLSTANLETAVYLNGMTPQKLLRRLLCRRPIVFYTGNDTFLLRNGQHGCGGFDNLSPHTRDHFSIHNYISYDEMQISALLSVSGPTYFINNGDRYNGGVRGEEGSFEKSGVFVGSVGARFERVGLMEWQHLVVTRTQNSPSNGYGLAASIENPRTQLLRLWADFYEPGFVFPSYSEVIRMEAQDPIKFVNRYVALPNQQVRSLFDKILFKQRMRFVVEPFLVDANQRLSLLSNPSSSSSGAEKDSVFVRAVGLGLGVWIVHPCQGQLLVDAYADVLREVALPNISDIEFCWFPDDVRSCGGAAHGELFEDPFYGNDIRIHFSKSNPADPIPTTTTSFLSSSAGSSMGSGGKGVTKDTKGDNSVSRSTKSKAVTSTKAKAKVGDETCGRKLLVAQYAWDGNSFPGNEYWLGTLGSSGDPAAACCSLISELQNPLINPEFCLPPRFAHSFAKAGSSSSSSSGVGNGSGDGGGSVGGGKDIKGGDLCDVALSSSATAAAAEEGKEGMLLGAGRPKATKGIEATKGSVSQRKRKGRDDGDTDTHPLKASGGAVEGRTRRQSIR